MRALELHVFTHIGTVPISNVSAADVLGIIERMQDAGKTNVVRKVGRYVSAIFEYAVMRELVGNNPASSISSEYAPYTENHHPILKATQIKQFFDDLGESSSSQTLKIAVEFTMRTLARTEEVRFAQWSEFDFENNLWIPAKQNRKGNKAHIYPLPMQVIELLSRLRAGHTGVKYLFITNSPFSPMSENAMLNVLYRMDYKGRMDMHGMRGTGSTILNETFGSLLVDKEFNSELIEKALSHGDSDKVRSSYNHSQYIESLRTLLQYYSDYLDALRAGDDVVLTTEGVKPSADVAQVIPINRKLA
jgi:integrase